jgi:hypothetical protein
MAKATTKRRRGGGRRVPVDRRRLPAEPLLEAVSVYAERRQRPVEELLGDALQRVLRDAAKSGTVTVGSGERCCDALGWHPRMVWGDAYDQAVADDPPHTATAPPGTATAWRQGCRCLDCRDANTHRRKANKAGRGRGHQRDPPTPPSEAPRHDRLQDRRNRRWQATTSPSRSAT